MLMNVTPDKLEPIMPKATKYQGDDFPARKKDELSAFRPVTRAMSMSKPK
jgi:hypothetical protein